MKRFLPWLLSLVVVSWVISRMIPAKPAPGLDVDGFGQLPVLVGGRVMPMDSLARLSLALMNHHGTFTAADGRPQPASRWLLEVFMTPRRADAAKVFEVANPDALALFGQQQTNGAPVAYSYNECAPLLEEMAGRPPWRSKPKPRPGTPSSAPS